MLKEFLKLFKIARKLSTSGAIDTIKSTYQITLYLKIIFQFNFNWIRKIIFNQNKNSGEKLCDALGRYGNYFYKIRSVFSNSTRYYW